VLTLVTGASGLVGSNLVRELLARGRKVRALVREDTRGLDGLDVEQVQGDLLDPPSLERAFLGIDVVYHSAALISLDSRDVDRLHETNVVGCGNAMDAALNSGVARLVHFSSIHAFSEFPVDAPIDETRPFLTRNEGIPYSHTKVGGQNAVQNAIERGLDAVVVNPTGIIGPYDFKLSPMGEVIRDLATGRLPALIPGGYNFVDVRDVVTSAISAETAGRTGECYILGGHFVTVKELAAVVEEVSGRPAPRLTCPMWLARFAAPFVETWGHMVGSRPKFTSASLQVLRSNGKVDISKAARQLGHSPRPLRKTVADTLAWQREEDD